MTVLDHTVLNKTSQDHSKSYRPSQDHKEPFKPYRIVQDYIVPQMTIQDHPRPYRTTKDHRGLYKTIQDHTRTYKTIEGRTEAYKTSQIQTELSVTHPPTQSVIFQFIELPTQLKISWVFYYFIFICALGPNSPTLSLPSVKIFRDPPSTLLNVSIVRLLANMILLSSER